MKNHPGAAMQYSGYPLHIPDNSFIIAAKKKFPFIVRNVIKDQSFTKLNQVSNDSSNWDANWFGNYE
jgi:hypothetical protein